MWKLIGTPQVRKLTHALCREFRDMEPAPGDRKMDDRRATRHKAAMINGRFRPCVWATVFCKETKKTYRVNGKHTSTVMAELNGHLKGHFAVIESYEADTLLDVSNLYATFDSRDAVRSTGDINRSFSHAIDSLASIDGKTIDLAVSAIAIATWGFNYSAVRAEERAALLEANQDFVLWLNDMLHGVASVDRKTIRRAPVAAAMFKTWSKDKTKAKEFWSLVRDGSGAKHTDPDRKLNKFLLSSSMSHSGGKSGTKVSGREMHVKCLHAWNAWRRGAVTDLKFYPKTDDPKVI